MTGGSKCFFGLEMKLLEGAQINKNIVFQQVEASFIITYKLILRNVYNSFLYFAMCLADTKSAEIKTLFFSEKLTFNSRMHF